jgi:tRNA dimethylallyltransferase
MNKPKILIILGPTATGKSALAIKLAKKIAQTKMGGFNGTEIISADSRQIYKGLDIGTGKVTTKEMRGIRHHMLDVANPKKQYSVEEFRKASHRAINTILKKKKLPIICGGTGFYIQSVVDNPTFPNVPANKKLRMRLGAQSTEKLFKLLETLDKKRAAAIDPHNKVRLIRAIEIAKAIGKVPPTKSNPLYSPLQIGIDLPDRTLKEKIINRLFARIEEGMLAEAKRLKKKGLSWKRMEELGLEYRYVARFLTNKISKEEFVRQLSKEIWHYAKRQRTWFKRDDRIRWFRPTQTNQIAKTVLQFLNN